MRSLVVCLFVMLPTVAAGSNVYSNVYRYAYVKLVFQRADGVSIPFDVEVATTPLEQARGLMYRCELPHDSGMIFIQNVDHEAVFWMANTYIPLDILFVRHDGVITKIVTNAKPLSHVPIRSNGQVRAVIEINGGESARRGLKEGDEVLFPGLGDAPKAD